MTSRRRDYGQLSPRLLELSAKTTPAEPYVVTESVTIEPPGRKRRDEMNQTFAVIVATQAKMQALMRKSLPAPRPPVGPEPLADDAAEDQAADHAAAIATYEAALTAFGEATDAWGRRADLLDEQSENLANEAKSATDLYNHALFGAAHDDVLALSEDWPPELWDAFVGDINTHFRRGVNPPPDGTCPECGHVVDEDEAGKAPSPST